jgi:hypothetical protein
VQNEAAGLEVIATQHTAANSVDAALAEAGLRTIARVNDSGRAIDLAIAVSPFTAHLAVVRCVRKASHQDHVALTTMLAQRDFIWAGLAHGDGRELSPKGLIETFCLSELDRLVARLLELREAVGETG